MYENIFVGFDNFKEFNFFAIGEDEAEIFLSKLLDMYGKIDYKVSTIFYFKFRLFTSDERKKLVRNSDDNGFYIMAHLEKIELYTTVTPYQRDVFGGEPVKLGEILKNK